MAHDPDPRSRANHEASHAVTWWWWVHRPGGEDDGSGGRIALVTIEPAPGHPYGHFDEVPYIPSREDPPSRDHSVATSLAGPVSDQLRGGPREGTSDVSRALYDAAQHLQPTRSDELILYIDEMYERVRAFLEIPKVRSMVDAVSDLLLELGTIDGEQAIAAMKAAIPRDQ